MPTIILEICQHADSESRDDDGKGRQADLREKRRTGGYEELDRIVDSATGYKKLEALMSGMSAGVGETYIRGWKHWAQYCELRHMSLGRRWGGRVGARRFSISPCSKMLYLV